MPTQGESGNWRSVTVDRLTGPLSRGTSAPEESASPLRRWPPSIWPLSDDSHCANWDLSEDSHCANWDLSDDSHHTFEDLGEHVELVVLDERSELGAHPGFVGRSCHLQDVLPLGR